MELQYSELDHKISMVKLIGKLDIVGVNEIETRFAGYCAGDGVCMLVDLSEVDFLASIGIRLLTLNGKSVASRGGKMALFNPLPEVEHVLDVTGIPAIIPIYSDLEYAKTALLASVANPGESHDPKKPSDDTGSVILNS
jgi:anti-sigma B factor antagonist